MTAASDDPRARLHRLAAQDLTKLLTLQDRNPHSPTYGCFDRNHWHLRITDFPSGMAQEFVLPLAQAYAHDFDGNPFYGDPAVREWVRAGIAYAGASSHADGSCDDYYPFEKAAGAAAFSLYAIVKAVALAELDARPFMAFIEKRAGWLAGHRESGRLSNHEALIANGLFHVARLTGKDTYRIAARARVDRLLGWQSEEGWFYEYQGCDPGYLTLTIGNLAEIERDESDRRLRAPIAAAVEFLAALQPPDGWCSGEWTSRNTNNYFPHGLEICGSWLPLALTVNDRAVAALSSPPDYGDDHILAHHAWSYFMAAQAWHRERPAPAASDAQQAPALVHWPEAGLVKLVAGDHCLIVATKKGGTFRLYRGARLVLSDTGVSLVLRSGGKCRNLVCHLWSDDNRIEVANGSVSVAGTMGPAKASLMTPMKNIVLRLLMLTAGRLDPDRVRRVLQRLLITGAPRSDFGFRRDLRLSESGLEVVDRIEAPPGRLASIEAAGIGPAQTSIYTVMSRVFHHPQRQPWLDLTEAMRAEAGKAFVHRRTIGGEA